MAPDDRPKPSALQDQERPEFLVVFEGLVEAAQIEAVVDSIRLRGGSVNHQYPPRLLIGRGPSGLAAAIAQLSGVVSTHTDPVGDIAGLDQAASLAVQAWNQRMSPEYRELKASRPDEGKPWDFHVRREGGDVIPVEDEGGRSPLPIGMMSARAPATNTSRYMIGKVAVGVVVVDGPAGGAAAFIAAEQANVVAEVQEGANGLIGLSPAGANLNFVYDVNTVTLTLDPATVTGEGDWRDPAMAALGYGSGSAGMYDYLQVLRTTKWPTCPAPDWAYIAFFTKYNVSWFAYASIGGPRLVMQYSNDGWGPAQIDRVFAHESGHIFGAADEYASSGCSTGGSWGYLGVANGNCANGNPSSVDCLMKGNTYNVCTSTPGQFGWRDSDSDGVPDPIDLSPGSYAANVGVTPGSPFYNNADVWIRNADDGDTTSTPQNPLSNIDNFMYARVRNFGGAPAEVVRVGFYFANFTGTEFVYPTDYTNVITAPDTPCPTLFALTPGASALAKVRLRPAQIPPSSWHPCVLVKVGTVQEANPPSGSNVWTSNNLAQRNIVIDYVSPSQILTLPIVLKNVSAREPAFELVPLSVPPETKVWLRVRDRDLRPLPIGPDLIERQRLLEIGAQVAGAGGGMLHFESDADVWLSSGAPAGETRMHLSAGSSVALAARPASSALSVMGNLEPIEDEMGVRLMGDAGRTRPFRLDVPPQGHRVATISLAAPASAQQGDEYRFDLVQYNDDGKAVGGIAFLIRVTTPITMLKQFRLRLDTLRKLGDYGDAAIASGLADALGLLSDEHLADLDVGPQAKVAKARGDAAVALRGTIQAALLTSSGLTEAAGRLEAGEGLGADIAAMNEILAEAQERLLVRMLAS
ncbi:MAG: hypothetical protein H0W81_03355 [Chloroflexi bacterium]|nr:hypothetical protein [Chloroflexota bacterium]